MSENSIYIHGFGMSGYRSFGPTLQKIAPLSKVNLFVGQNNAGKSNVLKFIHEHCINLCQQPTKTRFSEDDYSLMMSKKQIVVEAAYPKASIAQLLGEKIYHSFRDSHTPTIRSLNNTVDIFSEGDFLRSKRSFSKLQSEPKIEADWVENVVLTKASDNHNVLQEIINDLNMTLGGLGAPYYTQPNSGELKPLIESLSRNFDSRLFSSTFETHFIPAIRQVGKAGEKEYSFGGEGVIEKLAILQNPARSERQLRNDFDAITSFVRDVTGNDSVEIEIPYERNEILIHMDEKILPLESLGTGIHEVVILAVASTVIQNSVVCMEEPELHLHPILQRKLLKYLYEKTTNQYLITTHSAHLLDAKNVTIFHVQLENGYSKVELVKTPVQRAAVCYDLGYRASDIVQANCVIWVEGPSDRIYLRHWIVSIDPDLVEGQHYSIMFYGGRLLCHLTANDPEIQEFISLRRLNRHISILIDSDKRKRNSPINETKKRVRDEFDSGSGFAWVTKGREIENYISPALFEEAVKAVHSSAVKIKDTDDFASQTIFINKKGEEKEADKIKVANYIVSQPADLSRLDLKEQMNKIMKFIKQSNDEQAA